MTGHLVLSTLHTNDAASTITRLRNMDIPNYLIAASLNCIVAQRLARKICSSCKVLDNNFMENIKYYADKFNISGIDEAYIGEGCSNCKGTGIKGRQAIYEVLVINEELREAILSDSPSSTLVKIAKKFQFIEMSQIGISYVESGLIPVDEYVRVLSIN